MSLERFVMAQQAIWPQPLVEIRDGAKRSHWIWFVWPQLRGLGRSEMARRYGIEDAAEARGYLAHPVLGPRLLEISHAMLGHRGRSAEEILGRIDAIKLRSSATLFAAQPGANPVFAALLDAFCDGPDPETLRRLGRTR